MSFLPRFRGGVFGRHRGSQGEFVKVWCDWQPSPSTRYSGTIRMRGWAIAESGIAAVELRSGGKLAGKVIAGYPRPDVSRHYPDVLDAANSGFVAYCDTSNLPGGECTIVFRAYSKAGGVSERVVFIPIDHVNGYADEYHRWIAAFETPVPASAVRALAWKPLISVAMPVYRTPPATLDKAIVSVRRQSFENWELCIVDDGSGSSEVDRVLDAHASRDRRIRVIHLPRNLGIPDASNRAVELADGEFVALLDHDDELHADALYHVAEAVNRNPEAHLLYSDEDHLDEESYRADPFFKPAWSPDLLLAFDYVSHLMVFRRSLWADAGGFRKEFQGTQDYDLLLRMSRRTSQIVHIPKILYHWRTETRTADRVSNQQDRMREGCLRAIQEHAPDARFEQGIAPLRFRARYRIPDGQGVTIIVSGREGLERCLQSLFAVTNYPLFEVLITDQCEEWLTRPFGNLVRRVQLRGEMAPAIAKNAAAAESRHQLLLFLNSNLSVVEPEWLIALSELASREDCGAVGGKLISPEGTIRHAGISFGVLDGLGFAFRGMPSDARGYYDFPNVIRNVSAVSVDCLMVSARRFHGAGGFAAELFPHRYHGLDLCLRLASAGYRTLWTPHARLICNNPECSESKAPPQDIEGESFRARWPSVFEDDPYYSPNLTRHGEDYSYRRID